MKNPNVKNCNWAVYNAFKPGLHRDEYNYYNSNNMWRSIYLWAGIDCNGLVQRCAYAAGFWFNDVYYWGNIGNGEFNYIKGELSIDSITKYTNPVDTSTINWSTNVKVGDIVIYAHHIGIISFVGTSSTSAWMIHACGALGWDKRSVREDINIRQSSFGTFREVRRFYGL
ncbi:MAG: hypothetical protein KGZ86_05215 [Candidatus Latescibacteria bacterium]|nr:hypothetical protein [Candidatus Latescibacterota bacterium]